LKKTRAVLFDLDGVLVHTEHLKAQAHTVTVSQLGGPEISLSFYAEVLGRSHEEVRRAYLEEGGIEADPAEYTRIYRETYRQLTHTDLEVAEGVSDLLRRLVQRRYALAVVSSSDSQTVEDILSQIRLAQFFDVTVSADDVARKKPAPDAYLLALKRLSVSSDSAVVIEDSQSGIQAAVSAGTQVLAVYHGLNIHHDFSQARAVFDSLRDSRRVTQTVDRLLKPETSSQSPEKGEGIMKTTVLAAEYLAAGVLVLLALALLAASIFPELTDAFENLFTKPERVDAISSILVVVFAVLAYGVGLVADFLGEKTFEWWLERIKLDHLEKYLEKNSENLHKSPLLAKYQKNPGGKTDESPVPIETVLIGEMRFHVLMESAELYTEIESQLNRFRLIRVLVLVEVILTAAIIISLIRDYSPVLIFLLIVAAALAIANIGAVGRRFHHYCRAVERAYKTLVLDA
jgi:HAD superfamily hydrolase (TIGR01509 family)